MAGPAGPGPTPMFLFCLQTNFPEMNEAPWNAQISQPHGYIKWQLVIGHRAPFSCSEPVCAGMQAIHALAYAAGMHGMAARTLPVLSMQHFDFYN